MKTPNAQFNDDDCAYMQTALALARRGLGQVHPNPAVGCVIVKDNHIIGRGWTGVGGRPHAETIALNNAIIDTQGSTAYVTLEPCAHHGQTPPCVEALIKAKISRAVIATGDPDPRVNGNGIAMLEKAGIKVDFGLLQKQADDLNFGFLLKIKENRPLVTVKIASSADGKIAKSKGEKSWITGPVSRMRGHLYRANHDAIMVGIGTAIIDDPMLDCRIEGLEERSPIRVILDSHLRLPLDGKLCKSAQKIPLWIMTSCDDLNKIKSFEQIGARVFCLNKDQNNQLDIDLVMKTLATNAITRLLSEGGSQLNASLIKASLIDHLIWFKSATNIGNDGIDALDNMAINRLDQHLKLTKIDEGTTGPDHWQEFKKIQ